MIGLLVSKTTLASDSKIKIGLEQIEKPILETLFHDKPLDTNCGLHVRGSPGVEMFAATEFSARPAFIFRDNVPITLGLECSLAGLQLFFSLHSDHSFLKNHLPDAVYRPDGLQFRNEFKSHRIMLSWPSQTTQCLIIDYELRGKTRGDAPPSYQEWFTVPDN